MNNNCLNFWVLMARDNKESLEKKHAEENLDRKAKATVQWI